MPEPCQLNQSPSSHGLYRADRAIQHDLHRYSALFDTVESRPLTDEQRVAAVTMCDRQLVVAAAGSGKTSTMVGKVAFALHSGYCTADQVIVLAFNSKAANELDVRLRRSLCGALLPGEAVSARTLHALGLDIVTRTGGRRLQVLGNDTTQQQVLHRVLQDLLRHDAGFAEHWLLFRVFYPVTVRHPHEFTSARQWALFVRQNGEYRDRRDGFLTLRDELVPTQFEQAIANWLTLHGIDYEFRWASPWVRMYDRIVGTMYGILSGRSVFVLSHQALRLYCVRKAPIRQTDGQLYVGLDDFIAGTALKWLRDTLCPTHVAVPADRMQAALASLGHRMTRSQRAFLSRFIRTARLAQLSTTQLLQRACKPDAASRTRLHMPMLARLVSEYDAALKRDNNIDFEGMLDRATCALNNKAYVHPYTLVLVDEFQDTSYAGMRLLQALLAQNTACKLFAVGDDWQSIYRFAGAMPDVLRNFEHYFGKAVVNMLTTTFRFNQHIADVARRFIQSNPQQLRKHVVSQNAGSATSIILAYYRSVPHMMALCESFLDRIACSLHAPIMQNGARPQCGGVAHGARTSVYILGRYRHQRPAQLPQWQVLYPSLHIQFHTVHAAKGLEADAVIILGLHTGRLGFPSTVPDDALIQAAMPPPEPFAHAEERRLFYVALTRTRTTVYLLAGAHAPSPFIKELI